ncbi:hypothetical protein ABID08_004542 [Rhizobium binae]|uniref:Uncharacterized protein n=1 Tax=Rhizobium binae TaxID=1138190 RepID=A0ABV2ML19_9HYPH
MFHGNGGFGWTQSVSSAGYSKHWEEELMDGIYLSRRDALRAILVTSTAACLMNGQALASSVATKL